MESQSGFSFKPSANGIGQGEGAQCLIGLISLISPIGYVGLIGRIRMVGFIGSDKSPS